MYLQLELVLSDEFLFLSVVGLWELQQSGAVLLF